MKEGNPCKIFFFTNFGILVTTHNARNCILLIGHSQITLSKSFYHYVSLAILDTCLDDLGIRLGATVNHFIYNSTFNNPKLSLLSIVSSKN